MIGPLHIMMGIVMEVNKSIVVFSWYEHNSGMSGYLVQTKGISCYKDLNLKDTKQPTYCTGKASDPEGRYPNL